MEGLPITSTLPQGVDEKRVAAMTATLFSLAKRAALKELARGDLKRILIEGNEGSIILSKAGENAISCKLFGSKDQNDNGFLTPFPTISLSSPGTASSAKQKVQEVIMEEEPEYELYCKYCGSKLAKEQNICHVCGNKVI